MKLTREVIQEAITLGKDSLPKFTAVELAVILNVPLIAVLKVIKANRKLFKFSSEKAIEGLDATNAIQTMNSNEVWSWYLKNRLGGDDKKCLPLSDQNRLNSVVNSRVKWEAAFSFSTATFASTEATGADVTERVKTVYSPDLAVRLMRLGTISGSGQIPDRYLFGVLVSEAEIAARRVCGLSLYTPEWAMEEMLTEIDWIVVETGPRPGGQWIDKSELPRGLPFPPNDESKIDNAVEVTSKESENGTPGPLGDPVLVAAERAALSLGTEKKGNRRTKEQLDAERTRMNAELIALGMSPGDSVACFNLEKFKEAEAFYEEAKAKLVVAQKEGPPIAEPEAAVQHQLPGTQAAQEILLTQPQPPLTVPESPKRGAMPTLADLEKVSSVRDIKADIAAKAGMTPPLVAPVPTPPPVAAVQAAPTVAQTPPPAGQAASAEDLLSSLLRSTGQTP